ncbi:MAG: sulfatase-like hydrolase/transferase [Candidatus Hydrogenedentes bacterium]|nr:sulfatase-like hydrolase/transferase [Candidatus Hydrogenedentota bacterium]
MKNSAISRFDFLRCMGLGGAALVAGQSCARMGEASDRRPNFVIVFADDFVYRAIGYTNPVVQTPHLDGLARAGLILENAYVASPICVASRASLMSGMFPQQHGSVALDAAGFQRVVVQEARYATFAQVLSKSGYRTGYCGKSHLGPSDTFGFAEGQEDNDPFDNEGFAFAEQFLAAREGDEQPFLLWVSPHQPHVPLLPAQEWLDLYRDADIRVDPNFRESPPDGSIYNQGKSGERYYRDSKFVKNYKELSSGPPRTEAQMIDFMRAYYATISHLDAQIGALIDQLKASGQYENTYFVFFADNGYHLGNHGLGNKITMHEESVHVPMFVHSPLLRNRGARSKSLVSSLDIYPTLLNLAGLDAPPHVMGESLAPVLRNPSRKVRDYVASECVGVGGVVGEGHRMVRTDRWKYVLTDSNDEALFDELNDPYELKNVVDNPANAATLGQLRNYMREWMQRVGDKHDPPPE